MVRAYLWLTLEGLALFLALGGVIEGLRELHRDGLESRPLGWFALWAAGCGFHEWRKERRRADAAARDEELDEC